MTIRKPPQVSVPTWVERQIRDAEAGGAFDDLPGSGKPLPNLGRSHDDLAWMAAYLRRENVEIDALLPPALRLAKQAEDLPLRLAGERSEARARALVEGLNAEILRALAAPQVGPPLRVRPLDVDAALAQRAADRAALAELAEQRPGPAAPTVQVPPRRTPGILRRHRRRTGAA